MKLRITPHYLSLFLFTIAIFVGEATLATLKIPIDIHSSVMYVLMMMGCILYLNRIKIYRSLNPVFLLYFYILLRNISVDATVLSTYWLPSFFTCILFLIILGYIIRDINDIDRIMKYIYSFLGILMCLGCVKVLYSRERLAVFGGPNGYYKFALLFAGISFVELLFKRKKRYIFFVMLGIVLSLFTGSKGAILTLCLLIPILYWYYMAKTNTSINKMLKNFTVLIGITLIMIGFVYIAINKIQYLNDLFNRAIEIFSSEASGLTSVSARTGLIELSWGYFIDSPILGKGALYLKFDTLLTNNPQPYAHNIFFELLGEQGIIGFGLFVWSLFLLLKYLKRDYLLKYKIYAELYIGFLVYFIGAQFSGNILDSKVCLFFDVMIITIYRKKLLDEVSIDGLLIE